jgi:hypothetical protein
MTNNIYDSNDRMKNERHMKKEPSSQLLGTQTSHDEMSPLVHQGKSVIPHTSMEKNRRIPSFASHERLSDKSVDVTHSSVQAICEEKYNTNAKDANDKNQLNSHHTLQEVNHTPVKTEERKESVRLDQSWAQSPIVPGGSFDIFRDSMEHMSPLLQVKDDHVQRDEFMKVVAAIVIQTFFRRHLAYELTCRRYRAVLLIQQFCHRCLRKKKDESMELRQSRHLLYDVAAIQIQAAWRGFWVRDCILVDNYCATLIQKLFRGHFARWSYGYDIYRITMAQSIVRRFLVQSAVRKDKAATIIQSHWRGYTGVKQFINQLADILIVQSVCRRWLFYRTLRQNKQRRDELIMKKKQFAIMSKYDSSKRAIREIKPTSTLERLPTSYHTNREQTLIDAPVIMKMPANWKLIVPNVISPSESVRSRREHLAQLDTDELIRQWKNRRPNSTRQTMKVELSEF